MPCNQLVWPCIVSMHSWKSLQGCGVMRRVNPPVWSELRQDFHTETNRLAHLKAPISTLPEAIVRTGSTTMARYGSCETRVFTLISSGVTETGEEENKSTTWCCSNTVRFRISDVTSCKGQANHDSTLISLMVLGIAIDIVNVWGGSVTSWVENRCRLKSRVAGNGVGSRFQFQYPFPNRFRSDGGLDSQLFSSNSKAVCYPIKTSAYNRCDDSDY